MNTDINKETSSEDKYLIINFWEISKKDLIFEKSIYDKLSMGGRIYNKIKNFGEINSKISNECIYNFK